MHPTLKPRGQWSRTEIISFHLNVLALHVDPLHGRLTTLADALEINPITLSRWKTQGYVPWHRVKYLQKRYGRKLIPEDELCPVEYRRN